MCVVQKTLQKWVELDLGQNSCHEPKAPVAAVEKLGNELKEIQNLILTLSLNNSCLYSAYLVLSN
jgi:hypothetical protein